MGLRFDLLPLGYTSQELIEPVFERDGDQARIPSLIVT